MSAEFATKFEHNSLSEKVDEFILSLAKANAEVKSSLDKHDEIKIILKESFEKLENNLIKTRENLEESLVKTRHDSRALILTLEGRVRKLEDDGKYNQGVKDANEKSSHARDMRVDSLSKKIGIVVGILGIFSIAIGWLGWLHVENLKLINHLT